MTALVPNTLYSVWT